MKYKILADLTFKEIDYSGVSFLGAEIDNSTFIECNFNEALLTGAIFNNCAFIRCNFSEAYIFRSQFKHCVLEHCLFEETLLSTVDFTGTNFRNVSWQHTVINSPPLIVDGIEYPIVALDNGYMHVGCEFNTYEWFYNVDNKIIASMEGLKARRFWKKNKLWIFEMLKARGLYNGS